MGAAVSPAASSAVPCPPLPPPATSATGMVKSLSFSLPAPKARPTDKFSETRFNTSALSKSAPLERLPLTHGGDCGRSVGPNGLVVAARLAGRWRSAGGYVLRL